MSPMVLVLPVSVGTWSTSADESPYFAPWADDGTRGGDVLRGKANWYKENT